METNFGEWEPGFNGPHFDRAEVAARYDELVKKISAVSNEQVALTTELREQQAALLRPGESDYLPLPSSASASLR